MAKRTIDRPALFSKLLSRLPVKQKQHDPREGAAAEDVKKNLPELKMIFFIVDWNRAAVISRVFIEAKVQFHFISKGRGTASSEILDLLGIGASEKAVAFCLEQPSMIPVLVREVRQELGFYNVGAGIAFTLPLSGINGPILRLFKQPDSPTNFPGDSNANSEGEAKPRAEADRRRSGEGNMTKEYSHYLIMSVVNKGYSDEFMNTAREAGARGGTVLNARGQAHDGAVRFFGISVQDEKEVIIILADREKKAPIMRAARETHGLNSKAQGIVFSLPVDNLMSLSKVE